MTTLYDLRQKEVINVKDGCRYGYVCDIEFDEVKGEIKKLIVPGPAKILGVFGREEEFFIPWSRVKKVGSDIILVDMEKKKPKNDDDDDKEEKEEKKEKEKEKEKE